MKGRGGRIRTAGERAARIGGYLAAVLLALALAIGTNGVIFGAFD